MNAYDFYPDPDGYFSEEAAIADDELDTLSHDANIDSIVDDPANDPSDEVQFPEGVRA